MKIPAAVREHYLTYDGGYPESPFLQTKTAIHTMLAGLFQSAVEKAVCRKILAILREDEAIPDWLIPFADEDGGNLFCFSVREADCGAIYYYDHEFEYGENPEEHVTYLAESITTFINSLVGNEDDEE